VYHDVVALSIGGIFCFAMYLPAPVQAIVLIVFRHCLLYQQSLQSYRSHATLAASLAGPAALTKLASNSL
jgi:hypothetical protein